MVLIQPLPVAEQIHRQIAAQRAQESRQQPLPCTHVWPLSHIAEVRAQAEQYTDMAVCQRHAYPNDNDERA